MRVVTVGDNCMDVYEKLDLIYPTGNSVDFAIHLSKLGLPTSIISVTGSDDYGDQMIDLLKQYPLDLTHFYRQEGMTPVTYMDMNNKDRIHIKYVEGVMKDFTIEEKDLEFIATHDIVHSVIWGKINHKLHLLKSMGLKVAFDFATKLEDEQVGDLLPHVNYAFFSYEQHDNYIEDFLEKAYRMGPELIVATLGEQGSLAYDGHQFYKEKIVPVEVVNTVGAGDSFIAGFIYGVINKCTIQECLQKGAKLASEVVSKFEPY